MDSEAAKPLCSNGLDLANLAVSSGILGNSWAAISELRSQVDRDHQSPSSSETVKIQEFKHPGYKIIAFVTLPVTASYLQEESDLVPSSSSEASEFQFLCSEKIPSFDINKATISLFNSLQDKLSDLRAQVVTPRESIPHIITGDCLGGSIASLFTLWLLHTLGIETTERPLCITFGSPLIGDYGFQQAVLQNPTWSACFLHVVHKDDCFPKIFHPLTMKQSLYKPFGTFLVCSESGSACFEAPKSIIELLAPRSPESAQIVNYESIIKCLERQLMCKSHSEFSVPDTDLFKAGITAQVATVGLLQIQPQNMDVDALLRDIVKSEKDVLEQKNKAFDPAKDLNKMELCLAHLDWYKKKCENNGQGCRYYDSFKSKMARRDYEAINFMRPQRERAPLPAVEAEGEAEISSAPVNAATANGSNQGADRTQQIILVSTIIGILATFMSMLLALCFLDKDDSHSVLDFGLAVISVQFLSIICLMVGIKLQQLLVAGTVMAGASLLLMMVFIYLVIIRQSSKNK